MLNNKTIRIGLFLTISLGWSLIWFSQSYLLKKFFSNIPTLIAILFGLIPTIGLLIGAFIIKRKLPEREMSIIGKNSKMALLVVSVPIVCLTIFGVNNSFNVQPNLFGLLISMFTVIYAFFEEIGWRGYLQEEFKGKNQKWYGYVFVGIIWYLWHWYFLRTGGNPKLIMLPILIAASIGIGEVAEITKSILICGAVHSLANMIIIYPIIANNISLTEKLVVLVFCIIIWVIAIRKIEKNKKKTAANTV